MKNKIGFIVILSFIGIWIAILSVLLLPINNGESPMGSFLNPSYWWLVFIFMLFFIAFFIMFLISAIKKERIRFSLGNVNGIFYLLFPALLLPFALESSLGVSALENRSVHASFSEAAPMEERTDADSAVPQTSATGSAQLHNPFFPPVDEKREDTSIYEIIEYREEYIGSRVQVVGMYYLSEEIPEGYFYVFRFISSCCAADAVPLGLLVKTETIPDYEQGDWLTVEGEIKLTAVGEKNYLGMTSERVTRTEQPANPLEFRSF